MFPRSFITMKHLFSLNTGRPVVSFHSFYSQSKRLNAILLRRVVGFEMPGAMLAPMGFTSFLKDNTSRNKG